MWRHLLAATIFANTYRHFEIQNVINLNMCHAPGDRTVARMFSTGRFGDSAGRFAFLWGFDILKIDKYSTDYSATRFNLVLLGLCLGAKPTKVPRGDGPSRTLARRDISKVFAYVFRPVKSLYKHISLKLMVRSIDLR